MHTHSAKGVKEVFEVLSKSQESRGGSPIALKDVESMLEIISDINPHSLKSDVAVFKDGTVLAGVAGDRLWYGGKEVDAMVVHSPVLNQIYEKGFPAAGLAKANKLLGQNLDALSGIIKHGVTNLRALEKVRGFNKADLALSANVCKTLSKHHKNPSPELVLAVAMSAISAPAEHSITPDLLVTATHRAPKGSISCSDFVAGLASDKQARAEAGVLFR